MDFVSNHAKAGDSLTKELQIASVTISNLRQTQFQKIMHSQVSKAIVHIVTWRLNGETVDERAEQAQRIVAAFQKTSSSIPGLLRMEIGTNAINAADAWDLALYMVFASREDLQAYQNHPEHLAIKALVGPMRLARAQVDFELTS